MNQLGKGCNIVVIGGGWSGCAAAVEARKLGAQVTLLERTDMLLGTGLVGGIMRNNGRFTATEEMIAMGGGELFSVISKHLRHQNVDFPGHKHADLYDVATISGAVQRFLSKIGVTVVLTCRITKVEMEDNRILSVQNAEGDEWHGDAFIDTTGSAGPMNNCTKYGKGCAMCILRCPSFGGRISVSALSGVKEMCGSNREGTTGAMSGACKLFKESLSTDIRNRLTRDGVVIVPVPDTLRQDHLKIKCCQQYALPQFRDNLVILDTGHAKLMTPFYPLELLHQISGFENARYEDPYAGGKANSMRFFAIAPRNDALQVKERENLFCAGEKAGLLVGHTEAIVTGVLAGFNSVCSCIGKAQLVLSDTTAIGDAIAFTRKAMESESGRAGKYTFSGAVFFQRMKERGVYSTDPVQIRRRIAQAGLENVFAGIL